MFHLRRGFIAVALAAMVLAAVVASAASLTVDVSALQVFAGQIMPPQPEARQINVAERVQPGDVLPGGKPTVVFQIPLPEPYAYRTPTAADFWLCPGQQACAAGLPLVQAPQIVRHGNARDLLLTFDAALVRQLLWGDQVPAGTPRDVTIAGTLYAWPPVIETDIRLR